MTIAHQKEVALVAGGVTSIVANLAMGADIASISTWYFAAIDAIMARIQAGYALNRNSTMGYLRRHGALHGAQVQAMPSSLDTAAVRARMEIVGPAGFKSAIARGVDPHEALRTMSTQMAGVADEAVRNGDRDVVTQTALHGRGVVGWRRQLSGHACGFCAMLASRGSVYVTRATASQSRKQAAYHPHCHCYVVPLYVHTHEAEPASVRKLQKQWQQVTAGTSGHDAQLQWRRFWEAREPKVHASVPSGGPGVPVGPATSGEVRQILQDAATAEDVSRVLAAEYARISGRARPLEVDLKGNVETAREHAEGILRAVERFPGVYLDRVETVPLKGIRYAESEGRIIRFNEKYSTDAARPKYLLALKQDEALHFHAPGGGTPISTAIHEFGHVLDIDYLQQTARREVRAAVQRHVEAAQAIDATVHPQMVVSREVSGYAARNEHELVAEAFEDVMIRGDAASALSRDIFDAVDARYQRAYGAIQSSLAARPTKALPSMPAGRAAKKAAKPSTAPVFDLERAAREQGVSEEDLAHIRERIRIDRPPIILGPEATEVPGGGLFLHNHPELRAFYEAHPDIYNHLVQQPMIDRAWVDAWQTPRVAEMQRKATAAVRRATAAGNPIAVRTKTESSLRDILGSGRVKSQFETGTSGGYVQTEIRADFEAMTFGLPRDLPAELRPIYGYVAVGSDTGDALAQYGDIRIVLRDEVRSRTTVSVGDSLDRRKELRPMPIGQADWHAVKPTLADRSYSTQAFKNLTYVEAQVHGGVRVEDIAEVVFARQPEAATVEALERAGVRWRVEGGTAAKAAKKAAAPKPPAPPKPLTLPQLKKAVTAKGVTVPVGLREPALRQLAAELDRGVVPAEARARAVQTILDERKAVAGTVQDVVEAIASNPSERQLQFWARQVEKLPAELKSSRALADALRSGDRRAIDKATADLVREAKLKPLAAAGKGGAVGDVIALDRTTMDVIAGDTGLPKGTLVRIERPGYTTTVETRGGAAAKAAVRPLTPEEIAARTPVKKAAAKKAAPVKKAAPASAAKKAPAKTAKAAPAKAAKREFEGPTIDRTASADEIGAQQEAVRVHALDQEPIRMQDLARRRDPRTGTLTYYQQSGDAQMNGFLRRGTPGRTPGYPQLPVQEVERHIAVLDGLMAQSELREDITVYRGVSGVSRIFPHAGEPGSLVGRSFTDKGFTSTSASARVAGQFAGQGTVGTEGMVLEIHVPKGTHAVQISNGEYAGKVKKGWGSEQEILLERGLRYKVVVDEMVPETVTYASGKTVHTGQMVRHVVVEVVR